MSTEYFAYVTPNHDKIGIIGEDSTTGSKVYYSGDARLIYSKYDDELTADTDTPVINERFHMALVWGALAVLGLTKYKQEFDKEVRSALQSKQGRMRSQVRGYFF